MLTKEDFIQDIDTIEHIYHNHEYKECDVKSFNKSISNIYEYVELLEKALDKACAILSHEDIYPCDYGEDNKSLSQCYKCNDEFVNVKECWKEWCFEDVD